ncbi:hypothetical protein FGB62_259g019 [Gracilaria domingensis]|nr:hypothetical protein FGB62_259g019 [Gracilaria domingensis]
MKLMRNAQELYTGYHVQDLNCSNCRVVKRENMTSHCNYARENGEQTHRAREIESARWADAAAAEVAHCDEAVSAAAWLPTATPAAPRRA